MSPQDDETTLANLGSRLRAEYLVQQAQYTLEVAQADGPELWALLPAEHERTLRGLMQVVEARRRERTVLAEESRLATRAQNEWIAQGKVWRRKVVSRAKLGTRLGKKLPGKLLRIGRADTVQPLLSQMSDMVNLLEQYAADIPGGVRELVEEGRHIVQQLSSVDAKQEAKRLAELPQAVRAYHAEKARLYLASRPSTTPGVSSTRRTARWQLATISRSCIDGRRDPGASPRRIPRLRAPKRPDITTAVVGKSPILVAESGAFSCRTAHRLCECGARVCE